MPILSLQGVDLVEENSGFQYVYFTVTLDTPAFAPTAFSYYFQDVTAVGAFDDYNNTSGSASIPAGATTFTVRATVYGDTLIEGNETFQMVLLPGAGTTLAGNASALVATATIYDNNDGIPDPSPGIGATATQIMGPVSASATLPTLAIHDASIVEGISGFEYMRFLVTLDQVANAPVTFQYYTQDVTASSASGEYTEAATSVTIPAGQRSTWVAVPIYGDTAVESNETFKVILTNISNAVFDGGAVSLSATGTILDDDGGAPSQPAGIGAAGVGEFGPTSAGPLPTVAVHDVAVIEGNSGFEYARILITLDRPATAQITLRYHTQDGSASASYGDYNSTASSLTLPVGTESTWISLPIYGDTAIEGDEDFSVVFTSLSNAQFAGNVQAMVAKVTILDNDSGPLSGPGGVGSEGEGLVGVPSTSDALPTLSVRDASVIEGNSGFEYARFLVTLDRPATAPVTFDWSLADGSASGGLGDYNNTTGTVTLTAGQSSTYISIPVYGDTAVEGDEVFKLVLTDIRNAAFAWNAAGVVAIGTILDDDSGPVSSAGGIGAYSSGINGAEPADSGPVVSVISTSLNEGNSGFEYARVYVLLSQTATTNVTMNWSTTSGTATAGSDFSSSASGTVTIAAGSRSGYFNVLVYGDVAIEPDENFSVTLTNLSGAVFEGGTSSKVVTIDILDDDGGGTAGAPGTGPQFDLITGPTSGANLLAGTQFGDDIRGFGGDDDIYGFDGNDTLYGNAQDDLIVGGGNNDLAYGGSGHDTLSGGWGTDTLLGGTGNDSLFGGSGGDLLGGEAGNDLLNGQDGNDSLYGGGGNDVLIGGQGNDLLNGGDGFDTADYSTVTSNMVASLKFAAAQTVSAQAGSDVFVSVEGLLAGSGNDLLVGSAAGNLIDGGAGNDQIYGIGGSDILRGGSGNDLIEGSAGNDTMEGGAGAADVLSYYNSAGGVSVNLRFQGTAQAVGGASGTDVFTGFENLYGANAGNDTLVGNGGDNRVLGFGGDDLIFGHNGDDVLIGMQGNDTLSGGEGADTLTGGAGADTFDFNAVSESAGAARDTVQDFGTGGNDRIDLSTIDANTGLAGNQTFVFVGAAGFTGAGGEIRFATNGTDGFVLGDVDGNGVADLNILLQGVTAIAAADFIF